MSDGILSLSDKAIRVDKNISYLIRNKLSCKIPSLGDTEGKLKKKMMWDEGKGYYHINKHHLRM